MKRKIIIFLTSTSLMKAILTSNRRAMAKVTHKP